MPERNYTARTHGRVALLGLLRVAGEDDEACLVRLETLHVDRLALLAQVSPPVVDDDADTTRLLLSDAGLLQFAENPAFQKKWAAVKQSNKERLAHYVETTLGLKVNTRAMFDVQIKRLHEYKVREFGCFVRGT